MAGVGNRAGHGSGHRHTHVKGSYLCTRAVLPGMLERGSGRIVVVVASLLGTRSDPGASAYSAAKAAQLRLIEFLAAELQGTGLFALSISPGLVRTDMTASLFGSATARKWIPWLDHVTDDDWAPAESTGEFIVAIAAAGPTAWRAASSTWKTASTSSRLASKRSKTRTSTRCVCAIPANTDCGCS